MGRSSLSQHAAPHAAPSSRQVEAPLLSLHAHWPPAQQVAPATHVALPGCPGSASGSQQSAQTGPLMAQVDVVRWSLHCHSPEAQQFAPSKHVGLPNRPGSCKGSQHCSHSSPSTLHVDWPDPSLHAQRPSPQQVAPSIHGGLPWMPGASRGSQQRLAQTEPSGLQVASAIEPLHSHSPDVQQAATLSSGQGGLSSRPG